MDFALKHGPWKEIFKGTVEDHPVEIYTNPELVILVVLAEKEGSTTLGLVLEVFTVFHAMGELEAFVSKFPKEALAAIKHNAEQTVKFVIASSKPSYARYDEERANRELDEMMVNLENNAKMMEDVSSAYGLDLIRLEEAPEEIRESFFGEPLLLQLISPVQPAQKRDFEQQPKITSFGSINLGITKEGKVAKEPMFYFKKTIISEGKASERRHAMHILLEDCLLSEISAIVFDWQNLFAGLASPTKKTVEFQKFGLELDPIGFPVKEFFAKERIKIELSKLDPKGFTEIFGFGENPASKKICEIMQSRKLGSIAELSKAIFNEESTGEFNNYQKHSAIRFLKLVESLYENLFGEQAEVKDIIEGGVKGISRASIIHLEGIDERGKILLIDSLVNSLWEYFSHQLGASGKHATAIIFIPDALKFFSQEHSTHIAKQISENFRKIEKYGVGFVIEAEKEIELLPSIRELAEARISIVKENDAGIYLKNQKIYRVWLRPSLSICTELETETAKAPEKK